MRTKVCPTCGKSFSYEVGKGKDRKYCYDKECYNQRHDEQRKIRYKNYDKCSTAGCNNPANRVKYGLCENCYYRIRRTGTADKTPPKFRYQTRAGYIKLYEPNHPLADSNGYVLEHRKVMYEKYGEGKHTCRWCGIEIAWNKIVIDHLNENKQDNRFENLVISCNKCNRARGAMLPFIRKLKPEAFDVFIHQCRCYKKATKIGKGR